MESWKVHLREKKKPGKEEEEVKNQQVEDLAGGERQGCEPAPECGIQVDPESHGAGEGEAACSPAPWAAFQSCLNQGMGEKRAQG